MNNAEFRETLGSCRTAESILKAFKEEEEQYFDI